MTFTLGADEHNVCIIYDAESGEGVAQVFGLPMNTRTNDPCLTNPMWQKGLARGRLLAAAPVLLASAKAYLCARNAFREWHDANPGASGGRFSTEAFKVENAEEQLLLAIATAEGR